MCIGRSARVYMGASGKSLKESYQWQIKSQWRNGCTRKNVRLEIKLVFGDKRRRDIDNYGKILLDSLSGMVFEDDSQIQEMTIKKDYDKEDPRTEIEVFEL